MDRSPIIGPWDLRIFLVFFRVHVGTMEHMQHPCRHYGSGGSAEMPVNLQARTFTARIGGNAQHLRLLPMPSLGAVSLSPTLPCKHIQESIKIPILPLLV